MKAEISTAVKFLVTKLMTQSGHPLPRGTVEKVRAKLSCRLQMKFTGHWHPASQLAGNGYRAIQSTDGRLDTIIMQAFLEAGVSRSRVKSCFPSNFSIWVDPGSVDVQIGQDGSVWSLDIVPQSEINPTHFLAENDPLVMASPIGTPVKGTNLMAITPAGKTQRLIRSQRNDVSLTDISNVFAPTWTQ
eukprot:m.441781 g.441781  ORF g.441781 m.441781 type:complete len:188 (+) comp18708_c0_seq1:282-845(+)